MKIRGPSRKVRRAQLVSYARGYDPMCGRPSVQEWGKIGEGRDDIKSIRIGKSTVLQCSAVQLGPIN